MTTDHAVAGLDAPALQATYAPGRPVDLRATLGPLRRGGGDPTTVVDASGLSADAPHPARARHPAALAERGRG